MAALQLPNQSRRVPRRAAGQLLAFKKNDVFPSFFRKVIRHRTTVDTATNNDNLRMLRKRLFHFINPDLKLFLKQLTRILGRMF